MPRILDINCSIPNQLSIWIEVKFKFLFGCSAFVLSSESLLHHQGLVQRSREKPPREVGWVGCVGSCTAEEENVSAGKYGGVGV